MRNSLKTNQILELQPGQSRQYIDAETVFLALLKCRADAIDVRGSMFVREIKGANYLIRESSGGGQKSLGVFDDEKKLIFERFKNRKLELSERLDSLSSAAVVQQRMNKALRVGRVPGIVVKTLNALQDAGLQDHFLTIGTHALYAYESACGVRFLQDALATQDIDLLFDSRKRISFMSQMKRLDSSFIGALRKADPTFRIVDDQKQTAINDSGFEIDVIRRVAVSDDPHPFRMSDDEDDLWAVQIADGDKLLGPKRFSQVVVAETGHMAVMHTVDPVMFAALKHKMSLSPFRDPKKRPKDALQAGLIAQLIEGHMPQFQAALHQSTLLAGAQTSASLLPVIDGVEVVMEGAFSGTVKEVSAQFVVQDVGRGRLVAHEVSRFASLPLAGENIALKYKHDKVAFEVVPVKAKGVGR